MIKKISHHAKNSVTAFLAILLGLGLRASNVFAQTPATGGVNSFTGHSGGNWGSFTQIINSVGNFLLKTIMPILVSLAIAFFFWNMIQYIRSSNEPKGREEFRKYAVNSLIALFIMLSVWGIIGIGTRSLFGVNPVIPQLPTSGP